MRKPDLARRSGCSLRPFASAGYTQHIQIHQHGRQMVQRWLELLGHDPIDHHQPRSRFQHAMTVLQNAHAVFVIPIADDALHHDCFCTRGH
jgi:hypothetical protein